MPPLEIESVVASALRKASRELRGDARTTCESSRLIRARSKALRHRKGDQPQPGDGRNASFQQRVLRRAGVRGGKRATRDTSQTGGTRAVFGPRSAGSRPEPVAATAAQPATAPAERTAQAIARGGVHH